MRTRRIPFTAVLTMLLVTLATVSARADIVFDDAFNFREIRFNPPLGFTQGPDLIALGIDVIDTVTGLAPANSIVGARNLVTGEVFPLQVDGPVEFFRFIPYSPERAAGDWIIEVDSDVGSASALVPRFGTGPGTGAIPGVTGLTTVPGAQPVFSWGLPAGLPGLNDGNIDRIRARINDTNGRQILDATVDDTSLDTTSFTVGPGIITHNGAFFGQAMIEGFNPFNRSRTFEAFLVEDVGTGGESVTHFFSFFRDNRQANSVRFGEGDFLGVNSNAFPFTGTFVYAENDGVIIPLFQAREANRQFAFESGIPYDVELTDPWTIVAWNGAVESRVATHAVGAAELLPFVRNVRMLPDFLTPTFEWDLPTEGSAAFSNVQIGLFDDVTDERFSVFGPNQDQLLENLPAGTTSYTFSPGALEAGRKYVVRILLVVRNGAGNLLSRSLSFFNFTPILSTSVEPVFLPTLDEGGGYNFDFDVTQAVPVILDPHIAIGYAYAIGEGNPNFASVTLPLVGDGNYDLILFDDAGDPLPAIPLAADELFDFTAEIDPAGVSRFTVLGIEESAALDPRDVTAFMTKVTFTSDGRFTGTMIPITESLSTALDLVQLLGEGVQALVEAGVLETKQGRKLTKILDKVATRIERERIDGACRQLGRFTRAVQKLIKNGTLDAQDGEPLPLLDQTAAIEESLGIDACSNLSRDDDDDDDDEEDDDDD